jgi:hypothetical protein
VVFEFVWKLGVTSGKDKRVYMGVMYVYVCNSYLNIDTYMHWMRTADMMGLHLLGIYTNKEAITFLERRTDLHRAKEAAAGHV